jgi:RNA polymerase sigma factor (TIGR02999 family)
LTKSGGKSIVTVILRSVTDIVSQDLSQIVSELLAKWRAGDQDALQALVPLVYKDLRALAHGYLRKERPGHTLQTTALVHEAYLRIVGRRPFDAENRAHFVAVAARLMRQILVDYARNRGAAKRGANHKVELDTAVEMPQMPNTDVVALDDALKLLAQIDQQQSDIVELRFFGGLTTEEAAEMLGISRSTAKRDWNVAKAWLARQMKRGKHGETRSMGKN